METFHRLFNSVKFAKCVLAAGALTFGLGVAPGDAVAKVGMVAEIAKSVKTVTCPRTAPKGTDYVTVIVDTSKLEVWDDDHGTPSFEFVFRYWPQVFRLSSDGRKTIPAYCWGEARWDFEVPVYNITVGGLMAYDVALRTEIRNVPIDSAVVFTMELLEIDDIGDDYADFDPSSNGGGFAQFVLYPKQHSGVAYFDDMTGHVPDISEGMRKHMVGDGKGWDADFKAGLEFTYNVIAPPAVGGAIAIPKVGGATGPSQPPKGAEAVCRDYALKAVDYTVQAQGLGCNFPPPVWSTNHQNHYDWCMRGGNSQQALAANKKRASDLDACKLAKGNPPKPLVPAPPPAPPANAAALCAIYASQAVADAQKAAALNCGLFGPRWNADYGAHFGWCVAVSNPAMMMIESSARQTALDACSGN